MKAAPLTYPAHTHTLSNETALLLVSLNFLTHRELLAPPADSIKTFIVLTLTDLRTAKVSLQTDEQFNYH